MTEAFPWDNVPRYLLRDRDKSYGPAFRHRVRAMGVTEVITAPRSPWQNPSPWHEPDDRRVSSPESVRGSG
jgi:putative transposase